VAVRTVSVELKMKIADYLRGVGEASAATKILSDEFDGLGKKSEKFSTAKPTREMQNFSRVINGALKDGKTGFASIQQAIDDTKAHITKLRSEFATTGNASVFGDLKAAKKDLRTLENVFKEMTPAASQVGEEAGTSFASSFGKSATALLPEVLTNPIGLAIAAGVVAVAVPIIGGAVAGAVGAGVGLGLIGAAAAIQKNNPAIQGAFGQLKDDAVSVFKTATQPLVGSFVDALNLIDGTLKQQGPQFAAIFAAVEPAIKPVVNDLLTLETAILPGLQRTAEGFTKAVSNPEVQQSIDGLGKSFTALFNAVGNNPQVIADSFVALNAILGTTASFLDGLVHAASFVDSLFHGSGKNSIKEFGGAAVVAGQQTNQLSGIMVTTHDYALQMGTATDAASKSIASMGEHAGTASLATSAVGFSVQSMGEHSGTATKAVKDLTAQQVANANAAIGELQAYQSLNQTLQTTFDKYMSVDQAAINVKQAQADLNKQLGHGKKSWDLNTQAGRDNYSQLLTSIQADKNAYDARVALEGATKKNTGAYDKEVESLLAVAKKAGLSKDQVALLRQQFEVLPKKADTKVSAPGLAANKADAAAYNRILRNLPKNIHTNIELHYYTTGKPHTGPLAQYASRWGGVYTHADEGLVAAKIQPPTFPAQYAYAEPQTGGEAFIPKHGDYGRSMSILSAAAGWYGARVVDGNNGGGGGSFTLQVTAAPGAARALVEQLRFEIRQQGGGVVRVLSPR
jgi:hypothetical protein